MIGGKDSQISIVLQTITVVLLLYIVWRIMRPEGLDQPDYLGSGLGEAQVWTSGATVRRLGQKFTATNQGQYGIVHNAEIKDAARRGEDSIPVVMFRADKVPEELRAKLY